MNEQAIAKLQALKAEPGVQMRWQEQIDAVIADLSAPPALPEVFTPDVIDNDDEDEDEDGGSKPKSKVKIAAHSSHRGK